MTTVARVRRRRTDAGFTLVELAIVVTLIAILVAMASVNVRTALAGARARATATELGTVRTALLSLALDCGSLPRGNGMSDPGLVSRPGGGPKTACWRGPYIPGPWPKSSPSGGQYQYIGAAGERPTIRVRHVDQAAARFLAMYIQAQYPRGALGGIGNTGGNWYVDFVALDAPTIEDAL